MWKQPGDAARIAATLETDMPMVLDYLEGQLPEDGFLFGDIGLADVAIASFFPNARYAGFEVDAARWAHTAGFVARCLAHECFAATSRWEAAQLSTNPAGRRAALEQAGAPLSATSYALKEPRQGVMAL